MSSTIQEAAKLLLIGLRDPDLGSSIAGYDDVNWHKVYSVMEQDHLENVKICGVSDWLSVLIAALDEIADEESTNG